MFLKGGSPIKKKKSYYWKLNLQSRTNQSCFIIIVIFSEWNIKENSFVAEDPSPLIYDRSTVSGPDPWIELDIYGITPRTPQQKLIKNIHYHILLLSSDYYPACSKHLSTSSPYRLLFYELKEPEQMWESSRHSPLNHRCYIYYSYNQRCTAFIDTEMRMKQFCLMIVLDSMVKYSARTSWQISFLYPQWRQQDMGTLCK